jgi:DNA-binding Lrp family transcriptional regulator
MSKQSSHRANSKSDNGSGSSRSPSKLDSLDVKIIEELLADAYVSSGKIASKYGVPLSTIQRRRGALESMSILKLKYSLDPLPFGKTDRILGYG